MVQKILILESKDYNPEAISIYQRTGDTILGTTSLKEITSKELVTTLVCRLKYYLDQTFLSQFPNLKYIVSPTTGLNHIDLSYCQEKKIEIVSLKGETDYLASISSTSELAFALVLALVRKIIPGSNSVILEGNWERNLFRGRELSALTLGLLGFGRLGLQMLNFARAFNMPVIACDPFKNDEYFQLYNVESYSQAELFAKADIISVHVDYRKENENFITKKDFGILKKGSYFINTSRGELVNETDLIWALENGYLEGAGVDVLADEHKTELIHKKKLVQYARSHTNLIITPHIGGCTIDGMQNTELFIAQKYLRFLKQNLQ
ncbi:hydroxyacid dehydrogenase [bacterium]|nr:hydroxyacid dehydrogenase [bacterium]